MPFGIGPGELILLAVLALLFFGPKKLPEIGKSIGESLGAFKRAMNSIAEPEPAPPTLPAPAPSSPSHASAALTAPEQPHSASNETADTSAVPADTAATQAAAQEQPEIDQPES